MYLRSAPLSTKIPDSSRYLLYFGADDPHVNHIGEIKMLKRFLVRWRSDSIRISPQFSNRKILRGNSRFRRRQSEYLDRSVPPGRKIVFLGVIVLFRLRQLVLSGYVAD